MEWWKGVTGTLVGLCLHRSERLHVDEFVRAAVRAAVLTDLTLAGRVTNTLSELSIDTTRTQYLSVNALLDAVDVDPTRSIESWIGTGPPLLELAASDLVRAGQWQWIERHRRWSTERTRVPTDAAGWSQRVDRLTRVADGSERPAGPVEASTVAVAMSVFMLPGVVHRPAPQLLRAGGSSAWIVELIDGFMADARVRRSDSHTFTVDGA